MRYGYWMPVFGGCLRNVPDEGMAANWDYVKRLTQRSEQLGYDLTLIAELNLNDIKGVDQPALDAWSTAAALAAVTDRIELMVAVRPNFHHPALFAKAAANIDCISGGRLALNVVSSWWADEARQYGLRFDQHDDRYARTEEWLTVVDGLWTEERFSLDGRFYQTENDHCRIVATSAPALMSASFMSSRMTSNRSTPRRSVSAASSRDTAVTANCGCRSSASATIARVSGSSSTSSARIVMPPALWSRRARWRVRRASRSDGRSA